jgi:hypothetical protein
MFRLFDWIRQRTREACWAGVGDFCAELETTTDNGEALAQLQGFATAQKALPAPKKAEANGKAKGVAK